MSFGAVDLERDRLSATDRPGDPSTSAAVCGSMVERDGDLHSRALDGLKLPSLTTSGGRRV